MKRYKVTYRAKDDDCCSVWTTAYSPEEAERKVLREYWDIEEIIMVNEMN